MKNEFMSRKIEKIIVSKNISSINEKEEIKLQKWLSKRSRNHRIYADFSVLIRMIDKQIYRISMIILNVVLIISADKKYWLWLVKVMQLVNILHAYKVVLYDGHVSIIYENRNQFPLQSR